MPPVPGSNPSMPRIFSGTRARSIFSKFMPKIIWAAAARRMTCFGAFERIIPFQFTALDFSIGGTAPLDREHLARLKHLIAIYQPALFSEHLAWSTHDGVFLNDLLPLPYNEISLAHVCAHVDQVQDSLGMKMLLENPSTYVAFGATKMTEIEFLSAVTQQTGCGLLLDVNNVHVSAVNHGFDAAAYIDAFPMQHVDEFHLAGFAEDCDSEGARFLIDDHGRSVSDVVWDLYSRALARISPVPTLIEWDNDVPPFDTLAGEVARARQLMAVQPDASPIMRAA